MKHFAACLLILSFLPELYSQQKATISNVENFVFSNLHTFTDSSGQFSYACCYEEKDKSVDGARYVMQAFDGNLTATKRWAFTCADNERLLATSYNGTTMMSIVLNGKKKLLHYRLYNASGEVEKEFTDKLDVNSEYYLEKNMPPPDALLHQLGNEGYLSLVPTKHNDVFTYDANIFLKSTGYERKVYTPETDVKIQKARFVGTSGNLILLYAYRKKDLVNNKYESVLMGIERSTGATQFEVSTKEGDAPFLPLKVAGSPAPNEFIVAGNYFKENGKVKREGSTGLCLLRMNTTGQILEKSILNWKEKLGMEVLEAVPAEGEADTVGSDVIRHAGYLELHDFLSTPADGLYVIGEAYRIRSGAALTALNMLMVGAGLAAGAPLVPQFSQSPYVVMDLVIMHANDNLQVDSIYRFSKTGHPGLPFDADFTTSLPAQNRFSVAYRDYNQNKGDRQFAEKRIYYQNGSFTTLQDIFTTKATAYQVFAASEKEVMLAEYFPKQKQVLLSLKPLHP